MKLILICSFSNFMHEIFISMILFDFFVFTCYFIYRIVIVLFVITTSLTSVAVSLIYIAISLIFIAISLISLTLLMCVTLYHVCVYSCVHAYIQVRTRTCANVITFVFMHSCIYVFMYVCMHVRGHVCSFACLF